MVLSNDASTLLTIANDTRSIDRSSIIKNGVKKQSYRSRVSPVRHLAVWVALGYCGTTRRCLLEYGCLAQLWKQTNVPISDAAFYDRGGVCRRYCISVEVSHRIDII